MVAERGTPTQESIVIKNIVEKNIQISGANAPHFDFAQRPDTVILNRFYIDSAYPVAERSRSVVYQPAKAKTKYMTGYMYILRCSDNTYYTGSTTDLALRIEQHQMGLGANYTSERLPVKLMYVEEFDRIDEAFYREKQVQGWGKKKKEALIFSLSERLNKLAECKNETHFRNKPNDAEV